MILNSTFKCLTFEAFNLNRISISLQCYNCIELANNLITCEEHHAERKTRQDASIYRASTYLLHRKCTHARDDGGCERAKERSW